MTAIQKVAALLGLTAVAAGLAIAPRGCRQEPAPTPTPAPAIVTSVATASTKVRITQRIPVQLVEIDEEHPRPRPSEPTGSKTLAQGPYKRAPFIEQIIEVDTSAIASSSAALPAPVWLEPPAPAVAHGRLGIIAAIPVGLAVDYQVASVVIPEQLVGVPLELGLDLEANLDQVGAGVSVGGKAFATAGAFTSWRLDRQGLYLGAGLRF